MRIAVIGHTIVGWASYTSVRIENVWVVVAKLGMDTDIFWSGAGVVWNVAKEHGS